MKNIIICLLMFNAVYCNAQERRTATNLPPNIPSKTLIKHSYIILYNFQNAVKNATNCRSPFSFMRIAHNYEKDAFIERQNYRGTVIKDSARGYFERLQASACGSKRAYDSVSYSFDKTIIKDTDIHQNNFGDYIIDFDFGQTFKAFRHNDQIYTDYTIKKMTIRFTRYTDDSYEAKIVSVELVEVRKNRNEK